MHFLSGEIKSLSNTVLDLRQPVLLDDILDKLPTEAGLVHAYILPGNRGEKKLVARYDCNMYRKAYLCLSYDIAVIQWYRIL